MGLLILCWWCYGEVCYVIRLVLAWCWVCYVLGSSGCRCVIIVRVWYGVFCIRYLLLLLLLLFIILLILLLLLLLLPSFHIYPHHLLKRPDHHIHHPTTALFLKPFILYSLLFLLFPFLLTNNLIRTLQVTVSLLILVLVIFPLWYVLLYLHYLLLAGGASFCLLIGVEMMMTFWTESTLV